MDRTSKFMTDHSEGDKGKEAVMDFQVSWVLRMAADENYTKDKPIFRLYSKFMLFKLLGMPFPNPIQIKKVRVWKEWENIDLCVEVELERNKEIEYHFILIENKIYTNMKTCQRDNYPKTLKQYYDNYPDKKNYKPHYVLITCAEKDEDIEQLKAFCGNAENEIKWNVLSIYDIILDLDVETESELFNEFWIYNWGRLTD